MTLSVCEHTFKNSTTRRLELVRSTDHKDHWELRIDVEYQPTQVNGIPVFPLFGIERIFLPTSNLKSYIGKRITWDNTNNHGTNKWVDCTLYLDDEGNEWYGAAWVDQGSILIESCNAESIDIKIEAIGAVEDIGSGMKSIKKSQYEDFSFTIKECFEF